MVIIIVVGAAGICTVIVCEVYGDPKWPTLGGLGACPPGNFEKLHSLRFNMRAFSVIDHPLMLLRTQVYETS